MTTAATTRHIARTPRLLLRTLDPSDADALRPILADPEVMRFSASGPLAERGVAAMLNRAAESYAQYGFGHWAVVRLADERLLGFCGLGMQMLGDGRHVEIGYRLARDAWGLGYGTEAAMAARDYGFEQLGIDRIIAIIDPANHKSLRVAAKLGMMYWRDTIYFRRLVHLYACERDEILKLSDGRN